MIGSYTFAMLHLQVVNESSILAFHVLASPFASLPIDLFG